MTKPKLYTVLGGIAGVMLTMATLLCSVIGYQTLADTPAPIILTGGQARAWAWEGDTVIAYTRLMHAQQAAQIDMTRVVTCTTPNGSQSYDLQPVYRQYKGGDYKDIVRVVNYPTALPLGTPCQMETIIKWTPLFSMSSHIAAMPTLNFVVGDKP